MKFATLGWVAGFNDERLLGPIGDIPPADFEAMYYQQEQSRLVETGHKKLFPENRGRSSSDDVQLIIDEEERALNRTCK